MTCPSWVALRNLAHNFTELDKAVVHVGEDNGTQLQYSCLENPVDGGAWWAAVDGVTKSWIRLSDFTYLQKGSF